MFLIYLLAECWLLIAFVFYQPFRKPGKRKPFKPAAPASSQCRNKRKPEWVIRKIVRLKALQPDAGCRRISHTFNRIYSVSRRMTVSSSFVHYTLQRHHFDVLDLRRRFKRRVPRHIPVNDIWAVDMTGKGDVFGEIHSILGIVDHGSRRLVSLDVLFRKNAWSLLGHLFIAIGNFGKPGKLRSDNDAVFRSTLFCSVLALIGIKQQFSDPGCPWMNGRIERLFGTLKERLNRFKVDGRDALGMMLPEFRFWYNAVRPHQHLQGRTPDEVWQGIDPYARAPKSGRFFSAWNGMLLGYYLRY